MIKEGVLYFLTASTLLGVGSEGCAEKRPNLALSEKAGYALSENNGEFYLIFDEKFLGQVTHFQQGFELDEFRVNINLARNARLSMFEIILKDSQNKQQSGVHFETGSYNPDEPHFLKFKVNNYVIEGILWDNESKQFSRLKFSK